MRSPEPPRCSRCSRRASHDERVRLLPHEDLVAFAERLTGQHRGAHLFIDVAGVDASTRERVRRLPPHLTLERLELQLAEDDSRIVVAVREREGQLLRVPFSDLADITFEQHSADRPGALRLKAAGGEVRLSFALPLVEGELDG